MKTCLGVMAGAVGLLGLMVGLMDASGCATKRQAPPQDARAVGAALAPAEPGAPCGSSQCAPGEVCCNESCGICTPPGGMCTQQFCEAQAPQDPVSNPDGQARKGNPSEGPCVTDADCRAVSDYCTGCDCKALGPKQELAKCAGPGVRCLADPCGKQVAVCVQGYCQLKGQP